MVLHKTYITRALSLILLLFILVPLTVSFALEEEKEEMSIGINLSHIHYWSSQWVFKDAMKHSAEWWVQELYTDTWHDEDMVIPSTRDGYPIEIPYKGYQVHTAVFMHMQEDGPLYPEGTYTLRFKGRGRILIDGDAPKSIYTSPNYDYEIPVKPSTEGIHLTILESRKDNPIRDIQLMMPGFSTKDKNPYHPEFIEHIQPFNVIRYMKPTYVEDFDGRPWGERTLKSHYSQSVIEQNGLSHDYIIELSNLYEKDPWINIPHNASNNTVRDLAYLYYDQLSADRMLYVELSNEFWNPLFPVSDDFIAKGEALGLGGGKEATLRYGVHRTLEMKKIFQSVFGDSYKDRVTWTISTWSAKEDIGQIILAEMDKENDYVEALAIAPYFGGEIANSIGDGERYSITETFAMMFKELETDVRSQIRWHKAQADERNMKLLTYEAGHHFVSLFHPKNQHLKQQMVEVNNDPRMAILYKKYFQIWAEEAGGLTVLFELVEEVNDYGDFGLKRHYHSDNSPKWDATIEMIHTLE